ncbi:hypothetical protein [Geodermatophilus sabuli]|uniref:Heavy-metal-associated domain-containing protein n=1 Tax=Geodermatophilus sabuli TaxID=1564158 RepID=A0A285EDP8_9ACTN|nr:hypothetical protein [Geodermatophilus sabuli]MBB3085366.1 hypothetical protein [Geodermatophilus sabuli]SNX96206.1 hypothetical protein SAMN06893097_103375 [Geodermatophilus sabuli]
MDTPARLAVVALGLAAVFGAAVGVGAAVGPMGAPEPHAGATPTPGAPAGVPTGAGYGGLAVADSGYVLDLLDEQLPAGTATLAFRVLGPDGAPVVDYDVEHVEDLHLIAVRRDLSGYQRAYPVLGPDGTWQVPLELTPGSWRVVTDSTPSALGRNLTLGSDLSVPGELAPAPLPDPAAVAEVDGYTVVLTGEPVAGGESELTFSVSRDGRPVTDLQPYLGSFGTLVALRAGDLAYLHVHPTEPPEGTTATAGPHKTFVATVPSAGTYRLFLDFRHGGAVHTAAFTVRVGTSEASTTPDQPAGHGHGG